MVMMERIIRPHLPLDSAPTKTAPKCAQAQPNTVTQIPAPANATSPTKKPKTPEAQKTTRNSSWSYAYKKYMTKKEKEQQKCDEVQHVVTQGAQVTDVAAPADTPTNPATT